jgi:hypothetical protein
MALLIHGGSSSHPMGLRWNSRRPKEIRTWTRIQIDIEAEANAAIDA